MPSLVDVAPIRQKITISGVELECRGLSLAVLAHVLNESDELRRLMTEGVLPTPLVLLTRVPQAAHMIMAAGMGKLHDPEEERAAADLVFEDQFNLVASILELTFPGGLAPFFDRLGKLMAMAGLAPPLPNGADVVGREQDTSSLPQPTS